MAAMYASMRAALMSVSICREGSMLAGAHSFSGSPYNPDRWDKVEFETK
jgi:hypothetical protein